MQLLLGLCLLFFLNFSVAKAADLEIQVKGQKIMLPYWPATGRQLQGGLVMVQGELANEGFLLLNNLAIQFAKLGWAVLLINSAGQQGSTSWIEQLPEALSALRQKENKRLVLLHYGDQLQLSVDYFNKLQSKQVNGLILLSAFDQPVKEDLPKLLRKITFPVVDLTGQFDYQLVLEQAATRHDSMQNKSYITTQIPGADHNYCFARQLLVAYLHGWMKKLQFASPAKPPIVLDNRWLKASR